MRRAVGLAVLLVAVWAAPAAAHEPAGGYRWVGDGEAPAGRRAALADGVTEAWTPDLQAVLSLPSAGDVTVDLRPRRAADVAALPEGTYADGNAYEVVLSAPAQGQLLLAVPHDAVGALVSVDGEAWQPLPVEPALPGQVAVPVSGTGVYVAVSDHDVVGRPSSAGLRTAVLVGAPAALVAVAVLARRRQREAEPAAS